MTLGEYFDLMNYDYDKNDPKFFEKIQLSVLNQIVKNEKTNQLEGIAKIKKANSMLVTNPQTIDQPETSKCVSGVEKGANLILETNGINIENEQELNRTK